MAADQRPRQCAGEGTTRLAVISRRRHRTRSATHRQTLARSQQRQYRVGLLGVFGRYMSEMTANRQPDYPVAAFYLEQAVQSGIIESTFPLAELHRTDKGRVGLGSETRARTRSTGRTTRYRFSIRRFCPHWVPAVHKAAILRAKTYRQLTNWAFRRLCLRWWKCNWRRVKTLTIAERLFSHGRFQQL